MGMAISVPRYTVDDLDRFPDDGSRYELLDGVLIVTPAPWQAHQVIAGRIQIRLGVALTDRASVVGPGAISLPPSTQLEPDILVYPASIPPDVGWANVTEHWLVVEVLSRSSRAYDRLFKREATSCSASRRCGWWTSPTGAWRSGARAPSTRRCATSSAGGCRRSTSSSRSISPRCSPAWRER